MKLKIAICDDDAKQREFLAGIAAAWAGRMRHLAPICHSEGLPLRL